jgi:peptidoglycan pentaglycine glycine transferase (the first glycine)
MLRLVVPDSSGRFDDLIQQAPQPDFAQTAAWARLKSVSWRPRHYLFEQDGAPLIAITVWLRKPPFFPWWLAYAPRGPILLQESAASQLPRFWDELRSELGQLGAFALKVDPAWTESERAEAMKATGFRPVISDHPFGGTQPRATFRLDIAGSEDEVMAAFPKKTRYSIRYPAKNGVEFRLGSREDIPYLMEALQDTSRRKRFLERRAEYYTRLLEEMGEDASLMLGFYEGQVVAAGITVVCGRIAWAVYGGMVRQHARLRGYYGLNWERMRWAKSRGAEVFDFFGVPVDRSEGAPLYGLYQFKKSFGGELVEFIGEYELPIRPFPYWIWHRFSPWAMRIWRAISARLRGRDLGDSATMDKA